MGGKRLHLAEYAVNGVYILRRREPNCGPPTIRLLQTTEGEREKLIRKVSKQDNWPVEKSDLVNKHIKHFIQFANAIDFEKL